MLNRVFTFFGCIGDDAVEYETVKVDNDKCNISILEFVAFLNKDAKFEPTTPEQTIKWGDTEVFHLDPEPLSGTLGLEEELVEEVDEEVDEETLELDEELAQCERMIASFK